MSFLFVVRAKQFLYQFVFVPDDSLKEISLRLQNRSGNLEVQIATFPVFRFREILFQFIGNLLAKELADRQTAVQVKLLGGRHRPRQDDLTIFRN